MCSHHQMGSQQETTPTRSSRGWCREIRWHREWLRCWHHWCCHWYPLWRLRQREHHHQWRVPPARRGGPWESPPACCALRRPGKPGGSCLASVMTHPGVPAAFRSAATSRAAVTIQSGVTTAAGRPETVPAPGATVGVGAAVAARPGVEQRRTGSAAVILHRLLMTASDCGASSHCLRHQTSNMNGSQVPPHGIQLGPLRQVLTRLTAPMWG